MYKLLLENNQDIDKIVLYLDNLIKNLKKLNLLNDELSKKLLVFYDKEINPWTKKYYALNKEISKDEEEEMTNTLIHMITTLKQIERGDG